MSYKERVNKEELEQLYEGILTLKTIEDCHNFFDDLCTIPELKALSQRFQVAIMLTNQKVYSEIVAKTGASTATISRVNRSLNCGSDGYKDVFERLGIDV